MFNLVIEYNDNKKNDAYSIIETQVRVIVTETNTQNNSRQATHTESGNTRTNLTLR